MENKIKKQSIHNIPFKVAPFEFAYIDNTYNWQRFKVGTCYGVWGYDKDNYIILAVHNNKKGNGHFSTAMQWFYQSCERDNKNLKIIELWNKDFKKHLINERGFKEIDNETVIKYFKK